MAQQAHTRPRIDGDERNGGATCQVPLTGQADRTREYSAPERHGEAPVIVPSEMKGRKHPMTDDEFAREYQREVRRLRDAGQPVIDPERRDRIRALPLGRTGTPTQTRQNHAGRAERTNQDG